MFNSFCLVFDKEHALVTNSSRTAVACHLMEFHRGGKFSTNLSLSGRIRQVQNKTSCDNSGAMNFNSIRISTVSGHAPYKYPPRNTMPKSPVQIQTRSKSPGATLPFPLRDVSRIFINFAEEHEIQGCLIFTCHFPQKSPIISGSFAKRDLQLKRKETCNPSTYIPSNYGSLCVFATL